MKPVTMGNKLQPVENTMLDSQMEAQDVVFKVGFEVKPEPVDL